METMQQEKSVDLNQFKGIIRRRRKGFVLAFLIIFVVIGALAVLLPPIFRAQSTILIENQLIPPEYVQTTITSFVDERLQAITQQIMSRSRLQEIVDRFRLYPEMRERYTMEEILDQMREDIKFKTISADVVDRKSGGRPMPATIAFTVSYQGKDPGTVQKVANVLASLYLELNLKSREQRATSTTTFLQNELDDIRKEIQDRQEKISAFKKDHLEELPEYVQINLQEVNRLERDLERVNQDMKGLKERKVLLEGQLATLDPLSPLKDDQGKLIMNPQDRLKYLRLQLTGIQGSYSDKHPDIIRLKKEISALDAQVQASDDQNTKAKKLEEAEAQLALLKGSLGPKHPDVLKQTRELEKLKTEAEESKATRPPKLDTKADNPAYINIDTQIKAADVDMARLVVEERKINEDISKYRRKLQSTPIVEREYNAMLRDQENSQRKYAELMSKAMEAKVAQGMEETQRGERFTIIEPAELPEKPAKPNRIAILLIGFVLACGGGVGMAALREATDGSVKSVEQLRMLSSLPVLSVIPYMETAQERRARIRKWVLWVGISLAVIVIGLYVVDQYVMPLDVVWAKLERKLHLPPGLM